MFLYLVAMFKSYYTKDKYQPKLIIGSDLGVSRDLFDVLGKS